MKTLATLAFALIGVAASSCRGGVAPSDGPRLGSPRTAVEGTSARSRCAYLDEWTDLPTFAALVRPGTIGNLRLWGRSGDANDTVAVSLRYDAEGRLRWVEPIAHSVEPERLPELERLLTAALAPRARASWGVRLVVAGDGGGVGVLPSVICPPEMEETHAGRLRPIGSARDLQGARGAYGRRWTVWVALDADGLVRDVQLARRTGSRRLDQEIVDFARAARYRPPLHDGIPVAGVYEFELRVNDRY